MIKKFIILIALIVTLFYGCSEKISDPGAILIPPTDNFDILKFDSDSASITFSAKSFRKEIDLGNAERVLFGKFGDIKSTVLIKFFLFQPDSINSFVQNDQISIVESWIDLPVNYVLGDSTASLTFTGHNILNSWLAAGYNLDSLQTLNYDNANVVSVKEDSDSLLSVNVDKNLTLNWLKSNAVDSLNLNNGLVLIPDDANTKIVGFQGLTSSPEFDEPKMTIVYQTPSGVVDTIQGQVSGDVHVLSGNSSMDIADRIYLQSGIALRSYFDFDSNVFPKDAVINKATLTFYIDSTASQYGSVLSDSIMVQTLSDSTTYEVNTSFRDLYLGKNGNSYSGEISRTLQKWINGEDNQGLLLRLSDEKRTLNKVVLYGINSSQKPRLVVYYTDKK